MKSIVSILTITQLYRHANLKILFELIQTQTYKHILEWVIVDGSQTYEDSLKNSELINELITNNKNILFNIKYISYNANNTFGELKNRANNNANGDILIRMNDDDFYFPSFIHHCVDKLTKSTKLIAGSNIIYVHDIILSKTFKSKLNYNIFAYKKEYITDHSYQLNNDDTEDYFTNNFLNIEPLIFDYLMVKMVHNQNHFFNNIATIGATIVKFKDIDLLEDEIIKVLIPDAYYNLYKNIYFKDEYLDYDIVYLAGGFGIVWEPSDMKLGGSEQAIVNLSENWIKLNKRVVVYGNFNSNTHHNGVDYKVWTKFPYEKKIKNLIAWRKHGIVLLMNINFNATKLFIDFHDNFSYTIADLDPTLLMELFNKTYKINIKSEYHKNSFIDFLKNHIKINDTFPENKLNVIINGVRIQPFLNNTILNNNKPLIRNPYRFCYCSSYDRGLDTIIQKVWNIIYQAEPTAELHVYYGMDYIFDEEFKTHIKLILSSQGVMDHGRQPMELIIREKYLSTFHIYLNNSIAEIDCISIRESLVTGCIPIISNFGVFLERHGLQYKWDPSNDEICKIIAKDITAKMKDNNFINDAREQLFKSSTIVGWDTIAALWLKDFI